MKLTIKEMTMFAMLGALMYISKMIMEFAPNVHLLGVFTIAYTVVYRKKALYPIYIYVILFINVQNAYCLRARTISVLLTIFFLVSQEIFVG